MGWGLPHWSDFFVCYFCGLFLVLHIYSRKWMKWGEKFIFLTTSGLVLQQINQVLQQKILKLGILLYYWKSVTSNFLPLSRAAVLME